MTAPTFTTIFLAAVALTLALELWLAFRHVAHVRRHRDAVPPGFASRIGLDAHRKAADYTIAHTRVAIVSSIAGTALLVLLTRGRGVAFLTGATGLVDVPPLVQDLLLIVAIVTLSALVSLPFSAYRTFAIESRFGFNRTTLRTWLADLGKGVLVGAILGLPLAALVIALMRYAGGAWWLWAWGAWMVFQFLLLALYPTVIAPLFNKFTPMPDGPARTRIEALLARCGFASRGLYLMDGSKRSSHGNAYFTGFGRAKRIVFFDTLLEKLAPQEIEAVLAHELGHFRHKHVVKRIALMGAMSLAFLWLLGLLIGQPWFYEGLGVGAGSTAMGLMLFTMVLPVFLFPLAPLTSALSRRHEYEADAYAAQQTAAADLIAALVKLYRDNAATLTPDPLHSLFHDSHPPASQRIARLHHA